MTEDFNVIIERDSEGYYVASVPALRGCHTQARSLDTLMERVREVVELCLEVEDEDEETEPLELVGVQRLSFAGAPEEEPEARIRGASEGLCIA